MDFVYNDGGRAAAGYKGRAGDCVVRAIAIATQKPYHQVYNAINALALEEGARSGRRSSARCGVGRTTYERYLRHADWEWVPTMQIGCGCRVHLRAEELPRGRLVVRLSRHLTAVIDGVIHDIYNPDRRGTRCVYGYFKPAQSHRDGQMSTSNEENRKGRRANQVTVEIIRVDGTHETAAVDRVNWLKQIEQLTGANCLDSVDLREGRIMFVDDVGYRRGLPNNPEATALYRKVCKPGTIHQIKGDVVIGRDEDFPS